jgi:hypothetical protein
VQCGGAVLGTLAFLFAPQLSKRLLSEENQLRLPRFLGDEDEESLESTRRTLNDKIAQLNSAIDEVSAQLEGGDEPVLVRTLAPTSNRTNRDFGCGR